MLVVSHASIMASVGWRVVAPMLRATPLFGWFASVGGLSQDYYRKYFEVGADGSQESTGDLLFVEQHPLFYFCVQNGKSEDDEIFAISGSAYQIHMGRYSELFDTSAVGAARSSGKGNTSADDAMQQAAQDAIQQTPQEPRSRDEKERRGVCHKMVSNFLVQQATKADHGGGSDKSKVTKEVRKVDNDVAQRETRPAVLASHVDLDETDIAAIKHSVKHAGAELFHKWQFVNRNLKDRIDYYEKVGKQVMEMEDTDASDVSIYDDDSAVAADAEESDAKGVPSEEKKKKPSCGKKVLLSRLHHLNYANLLTDEGSGLLLATSAFALTKLCISLGAFFVASTGKSVAKSEARNRNSEWRQHLQKVLETEYDTSPAAAASGATQVLQLERGSIV